MTMLLIALIAAVYYLVIPTGLVIGAWIALAIAPFAVAVALVAAVPVPLLCARLTASPRTLARLAGWGGLVLGSSVGIVAATAASVLVLIAVGALLAVPQFGPGTP